MVFMEDTTYWHHFRRTLAPVVHLYTTVKEDTVSKQLDKKDKGRLKKALTKAKILKLVMIHRRAKRENYADKVYNQIKELLKEV
jgi:septum formation topological specificity factor MinE